MSEKIAGPCVVCGATDYSLTLGGPTICPSCDCGRDPEIGRLINLGQKQHAEIIRLRTELATANERLSAAERDTERYRIGRKQGIIRATDELHIDAAIDAAKGE